MNSADRSAFITGIGVVGPQGSGWQGVCNALRSPRPLFKHVPPTWLQYPGGPDGFIAPLPSELEPELAQFETVATDRASAMALMAAQQAWSQAQPTVQGERAGVFWGTGMGGLHTAETSYNRLLVDHAPLRPTTVVRIMGNSAAAQLAMKYQLRGPNHTYSVACASSAQALGEALIALRSGRIDVALVGGSESMLVPGVMTAWGALKVLSTRKTAESAALACRPFSARRSGLVIGEGAAALVLESAAHARARGARPLAVLSGYGSSCDASSLVHPSMQGQARAMRDALADSGLSPTDIDTVSAHATGTGTGDVVEAEALREVFGERVPPVCATKSIHGHLLGAAGALQAAFAVASLTEQLIPATLGVEPVDPKCAHLDLGSGVPRAARLTQVLSNSFAFGGANISLVFRQADAS